MASTPADADCGSEKIHTTPRAAIRRLISAKRLAPGARSGSSVTAPTPIRAAEYYPGNYWYSLMNVPAKNEFPGTGANGNGISEMMASQAQWLRILKTDSCESCHQMGSKGTREIPEALGRFATSVAAWERRVLSGQAGQGMSSSLRPRAECRSAMAAVVRRLCSRTR